jgi:uncharacterized membrane protein
MDHSVRQLGSDEGRVASSGLVTWTQLIYALHALSLFAGIIGTATVIGAFLTGWPSIIAVILNYVKRSEVRGTWLESHFQWQIRTFWFGVLWVGLCIGFIVVTLGIGVLVAWLPLALVGLWFIYRTARGWLALTRQRPMYV